MSMNYEKKNEIDFNIINKDIYDRINSGFKINNFMPKMKILTEIKPIVIKVTADIMQNILDELTKTDFRQLFNPSLYGRLKSEKNDAIKEILQKQLDSIMPNENEKSIIMCELIEKEAKKLG